MFNMQLHDVARALGGRVYKDQVGAPAPGHKRSDRSLSVKPLPNGDFLVNSHRGEDWRDLKAYVRQRCGMPAWQPNKKSVKELNVPQPVRLQFLGETLKVCRHRHRITFAQFKLLINDARLAGVSVGQYADEFGFGAQELELAMSAGLAHYDADDRARILKLTYFERMKLGLRRTGSVDVDKATRERLTADRRNAKKRAKRAAARAAEAARGTHIDPLPGRQSLTSKRETTSRRANELTLERIEARSGPLQPPLRAPNGRTPVMKRHTDDVAHYLNELIEADCPPDEIESRKKSHDNDRIELTDKAKAWLAENYKSARKRNRPSKARWQEKKRRHPNR